MSFASLEREVLRDARVVLNNPKLRMKDIMEWSTGTLVADPGEIVVLIPNNISVAVKAEFDKRKAK